ncbi:hypothetical protein BC831DRAFT_43443 [Entophlyctis helioformis]|nr:hypothetical protein BC831DRAFT_43443 [Entophlyctis helioformis]
MSTIGRAMTTFAWNEDCDSSTFHATAGRRVPQPWPARRDVSDVAWRARSIKRPRPLCTLPARPQTPPQQQQPTATWSFRPLVHTAHGQTATVWTFCPSAANCADSTTAPTTACSTTTPLPAPDATWLSHSMPRRCRVRSAPSQFPAPHRRPVRPLSPSLPMRTSPKAASPSAGCGGKLMRVSCVGAASRRPFRSSAETARAGSV